MASQSGVGGASEAKALSLDEALSLLPWGRFHWLLFATCGLGYTADCVELLLLSFAFPELMKDWGISKQVVSLASTFSNLGIMLGALAWGACSDCLGRRIVFLCSVAMTFLCGLASAASPAFWAFTACRFGVGFGIGGNLAVDFALFMEFVPLRLRQRVMMLLTMWGVLGVGMIALAALFLIPAFGWRVYVGVLSLPSLLLLVLRAGVPESPALLHARGRTEEALEVLHHIARKNGSALPSGIALQPAAGQEGDEEDGDDADEATPAAGRGQHHGGRGHDGRRRRGRRAGRGCGAGLAARAAPLLEPLVAPGMRGTTLCIGMAWLLMSFSYTGFTLWLPELLRGKGIGSVGVYASYGVMVLAEVPSLLIATALVDRGVEKRWVLAGSAAGCSLACAGCALVSSRGLVTAVLASSYFFAVSAWASLYVITPEAYPPTCRSTASGLARIWSNVGGMLTAPLGAWLLEEAAWAPLLAYAAGFLALVLVAASLQPPSAAAAP